MLILAAQNLNNFRFQTNIVCDDSVLGKSAVKIFKLLAIHLNKSLIRKQQMLFKQGNRTMKYNRTRYKIILVYTF